MAIRVFEIAKEYSRSPKEIMDILSKAGIRVSSQTTELDEHALHTLTAKIGKYNLTVVDGDQESEVAHDELPPSKAKSNKKKKGAQKPKPNAPRLAVRVIKKHDQPEAEVEADTEEKDAPNKPRPKLRKPKVRSRSIEERIKANARRSDDDAPQEKADPPKPSAAKAAPSEQAAPKAPSKAETPPSANAEPAPQPQEGASGEALASADADKKQDKKMPAKRAESPVSFEMGSLARDRREHRGGRDRDNRGGYQGRDNRGGDNRGGYQGRDNRGGDNRQGGGGYQGRDNRQGSGGGYQGRDNRQGGGGGYQSRDNRQGGGGGYQGRDNRQGGGGGYQGRDNRQGGGGGYQGRDNRQGGGGGYQGRDNRQGGGGGYQGRDNRPGGGGGYQGRGPGGPGRGPGGPGGPGRGPGGPGGPGRGPGGPGRGPGGPGRGPGGPGRGPGGPGRPGFGRGGGGGGGFGGPGQPVKGGGNRSRFGAQRPGSKKKRGRKRRNEEQIDKIKVVTASRVELPEEDLGIIMLSEGATIKELAEKVERKAKDIIKRLFEKGIMATLNDVLDSDLAIEIAKDFGYLAEIVSFEEDLQIKEEESIESEQDDANKEPRAPIVTIMGHVDHGKTTLLDAVRKAKVASGEAGGITQHIGAYSVPYNDKRIVFLDTPGHEAFTKMRARGASVTDIVILVVAADDGVKPQTVEAINHAKAAKVPIITCINKIDKPEANPARVKQMLTEHELVVEEFGGDSPCVEVSAKQNLGLDDLLEMILLVAELNDYQASVSRRAKGTVIEAKLDRGRGPVATVVVQDGVLRVGEYFITGQTYGKIRAMHDDLGRDVVEAPPSTPVEILGVQEVPTAGDLFQVIEDEVSARKISSFRKEKAREDQLRRQHTSLDQLFSNLKQSEIKDLCIIIKADVQGSIEGMTFALNKIKSEKVNLRIVHQGVGSITENDVLLAVASDAIIIGFNTKSERKAQDLAEQEGIDVRHYSVIYEVVKEIEAAMLGLVAPTFEEREIGRAVVKQIFSVAKLGKVAGCQVENGLVKREAKVRVVRGSEEIHRGSLQTLKRFRDDVNEVKSGFECGVGIQDYSDLREGDLLYFYILEEVQATQL